MSSFIKGARLKKDGTMLLIHHSGRIDSYKGISKELFLRFKVAKSKGTFFNENIRGKFEHSCEKEITK